MLILNQTLIEEFKKKHPAARSPLGNWSDIVAACTWSNLIDLKATFPSADYVAPYTVFNLGGNNFRLIATVMFSEETLAIVRIMTHAEYNRWKP
jgi:mRNA interferase HigB